MSNRVILSNGTSASQADGQEENVDNEAQAAGILRPDETNHVSSFGVMLLVKPWTTAAGWLLEMLKEMTASVR